MCDDGRGLHGKVFAIARVRGVVVGATRPPEGVLGRVGAIMLRTKLMPCPRHAM